MEPLSKGFGTLQSGMSSLTRFLFLPPVGGAGLGGGWNGREQVLSKNLRERAGESGRTERPRDLCPDQPGPGPPTAARGVVCEHLCSTPYRLGLHLGLFSVQTS